MTYMPAIDAFPQPAYQKDLVLSLLKKAAANELLTYNLYKQVKDSFQDSYLKDLVHSASLEDWSHYKTLLDCIRHLQQECHDISFTRTTAVQPDTTDCSELLAQIEKAEEAAINFQHSLCAMTFGHDYRIFDHAYALLNENMQHNQLVKEQLWNRI